MAPPICWVLTATAPPTPQHKRASAQALAEACRAKQSNSGLCSSSSNEAIEQRSSRSNRIAASTGTFKPQWKQSSSGFSRRNRTRSLSSSSRSNRTRASEEACRARQSISGLSRNSHVSSETIDQRASAQACFSTSVLQHKRASAQASAEACRAKQSNKGFSRNSRASSDSMEQRLQHKRQQKPVERSNQLAASTETAEFRPEQSNSGFSTSASEHKRA